MNDTPAIHLSGVKLSVFMCSCSSCLLRLSPHNYTFTSSILSQLLNCLQSLRPPHSRRIPLGWNVRWEEGVVWKAKLFTEVACIGWSWCLQYVWSRFVLSSSILLLSLLYGPSFCFASCSLTFLSTPFLLLPLFLSGTTSHFVLPSITPPSFHLLLSIVYLLLAQLPTVSQTTVSPSAMLKEYRDTLVSEREEWFKRQGCGM